MKPTRNIAKSLSLLRHSASAEAHDRILNDILKVFEDSHKPRSAKPQPTIWRAIMTRRSMTLAAAGIVILAAVLAVCTIGTPNMASVAWADVAERIAKVRQVHIYCLKSRSNVVATHFEAWYADGKMVTRGSKGSMHYDDGQTSQGFEEHKRRTVRGPSLLA